MALQFDIFQLDTSLTKTNIVTDVDVVNIGDIEEVIELEEGRYAIGNLDVTAHGLNIDYFRDAGDVYNPFVFVVREDGNVIYHGIIDGESVEYNRKTLLTGFTVASWEYMLSQAGNVPARSIFEAPLVDKKVEVIAGRIVKFWTDSSTVAVIGDVIVTKIERGNQSREVRTIVQAVSTELGRKVLWGFIPQDTEDFLTLDIDSTDTGTDGVLLEVSPQEPVGKLHDFINITDEDAGRIFLNAFPVNDNAIGLGQNVPQAQGRIYTPRIEPATINVLFKNGSTVVFKTQLARIWYFFNDEDASLPAGWSVWCRLDLTENLPSGLTYDSVLIQDDVQISVEKINNIKILGRDLYGYSGDLTQGAFGFFKYPWYDTDQVIEGLLTLQSGSVNPFGVLSHIVQTPITIDGTIEATLDRIIELPDDPLGALRVIQNTTKNFLRFEPTWDVPGDLPTLTVRVIPRKHINTGDPSITAVAANDVIEWTEKASNRNIKAIVVKPNKEYNKPFGDTKYMGIWYVRDGSVTPDTEPNPELLTEPKGDGVINIEVACVPSYSASYEFSGDASPIANDDKLKEIAKFYWEFYDQIPRQVTGSFAERNPDVLGKFASWNESTTKPLQETVFITRMARSLKPNLSRTDFEGYISPTFIEPTGTPPVAVISGRLEYTDVDGGGDETIYLSGLSSYDNDDGQLTFEWREGVTVLSDESILQDDLTVGSHTITLEVTNTDTGLSDTAQVVVTILAAGTAPKTVGTLEDFFTIQRVQEQTTGPTQIWGRVWLYPKIDRDEIADVRYRRQKGAGLAPLDFTTGSPTTWYTFQSNFFNGAGEGHHQAQVELANNHNSFIEIYVEFEEATGRAPVIGTFSFDHSPIPNFAAGLQLIGNDVWLSWHGDEDLSYIRYAKSTIAMPSDAQADSGTQETGQRSDGVQIHTGLAEGETLYVKIAGFNVDDIQSPDYDVGAVTMPVSGSGAFSPVSVGGDYEQNGSNLETSLTILDPESRVTRVRFWERANGADTFTLVVDDSTAPFQSTRTTGLSKDYLTTIKWRVDWDDALGNGQAVTGEHTEDYDVDPELQPGYPVLHVQDDGQVWIDVAGDADVASMKIKANTTNPGTTDRVLVPSGSSYQGVITGFTLNAGQKGYIRVKVWSETSYGGSNKQYDYAVEHLTTGEDNEALVTALHGDVDENGNVKIFWSKSAAADDIRFFASRTDTTPDSGDEIYGPFTASDGEFTLNNTLDVSNNVYYVRAMARVATVIQHEITIEIHFRHVGLIASGLLQTHAQRFLLVSGSFTTPSATTLSWSGIQIRTYDGSTYTPNGGSIFGLTTTPRFVYLDTAGTPSIKSTTSATTADDDDHIVLGVARRGASGATEAFWVPVVGVLGGGMRIDADVISANSITSAKIQAAAIDAIHINANAINASHISAGAVTASKINVTDLEAVAVNTGSLTVNDTISMGGSGEILLASGDVVFDNNGITIIGGTTIEHMIQWEDSGGEILARIYAFESGTVDNLFVDSFEDLEFDSQGAPRFRIDGSGSGQHILLEAPKIIFGGLTSGLFIDKGAAATTGSQEGLLYVDSGGALRYKGPNSGTDTQLAPA